MEENNIFNYILRRMQSWLKVGNPPIALDFGTRVSTWITSQPYEPAMKVTALHGISMPHIVIDGNVVEKAVVRWRKPGIVYHSSSYGKQQQALPGSPAFGNKQWSTQVQQKYDPGRHTQQSSPGFGGHHQQAYSPGFGGHLTQRESYKVPTYDIDSVGTPGFKQQQNSPFKFEFERRAHARRDTHSRRQGEAKGARAVPQRASRLFRRR